MKNKDLNSGVFELLRPNAAGIDIASQMHYVAVPFAEMNRVFGNLEILLMIYI